MPWPPGAASVPDSSWSSKILSNKLPLRDRLRLYRLPSTPLDPEVGRLAGGLLPVPEDGGLCDWPLVGVWWPADSTPPAAVNCSVIPVPVSCSGSHWPWETLLPCLDVDLVTPAPVYCSVSLWSLETTLDCLPNWLVMSVTASCCRWDTGPLLETLWWSLDGNLVDCLLTAGCSKCNSLCNKLVCFSRLLYSAANWWHSVLFVPGKNSSRKALIRRCICALHKQMKYLYLFNIMTMHYNP